MDYQEMYDLLRKINTTPHAFYGMYSRMGVSFSENGKLQINLAKALDSDSKLKGKREKGTEVYDNDNKQFFTLSSNECIKILNVFDKIREGSYKNKDKNIDPKYSMIYTLVHYSGDDQTNPNKFALSPSKKEETIVGLKISIIPENKDNMVSFVLKDEDIDIFKNFLVCGSFGSCITQVYASFVKSFVKALYSFLPKTNNYKNGNSYNKKNNKVEEDNDGDDEDEAPKKSFKKYNKKEVEEKTEDEDDDIPWSSKKNVKKSPPKKTEDDDDENDGDW